jgi:hypothetical protein
VHDQHRGTLAIAPGATDGWKVSGSLLAFERVLHVDGEIGADLTPIRSSARASAFQKRDALSYGPSPTPARSASPHRTSRARRGSPSAAGPSSTSSR